MDWWPPYLFAASYAAQAVIAVGTIGLLVLVDIPRPPPVSFGSGRPLAEIARRPEFVVAVICGVVTYALMNLVMTAAPLAMRICGHSISDSNLAIQWHVIAMYGPSFFTGILIARFGTPAIIATGLGLIAMAGAVDLFGQTVGHFWLALVLLGVGWNFGFIGASALIAKLCTPDERNKVQAFNDFLIFGTMAIGSFSSGQLLAHAGWSAVNAVVFPPVALALGLLAWQSLTRKRRAKLA
jgi:predicted MFS family arabinose efflux permease